jgi:hypothetical protein
MATSSDMLLAIVSRECRSIFNVLLPMPNFTILLFAGRRSDLVQSLEVIKANSDREFLVNWIFFFALTFLLSQFFSDKK